jgi:hypothetical protein
MITLMMFMRMKMSKSQVAMICHQGMHRVQQGTCRVARKDREEGKGGI